jgi:hypothetical protein
MLSDADTKNTNFFRIFEPKNATRKQLLNLSSPQINLKPILNLKH